MRRQALSASLSLALIGTLSPWVCQAQQAPGLTADFAYFADIVVEQSGPFTFRSLRTKLTFVNPGGAPVQARVRISDLEGAERAVTLRRDFGPLLENPFSLPAHSSTTLLVETPGGGLGRLRVEGDAPLAVLETLEIVSILDAPAPVPLIRVLSGAELPPTIAMTAFSMRVEETEGAFTGLSIADAGGAAPVRGVLTLRDDSGVQRGTAEVVIEPGRQWVRLASELFPELAEIGRGTVSASFDRAVEVASIRGGFGGNLSQNLVSAAVGVP